MISAITPTICRLFGIRAPEVASAAPLGDVLSYAEGVLADRPVERCLVFAPDAIGEHLEPTNRDAFSAVAARAPLRAPLRAAYPSVTPVCFASMFTGAEPAEHGIERPVRPVLGCETLFDVLSEAGVRTAIVAVEGSSCDRIFRRDDLDQFSEPYDDEVADRAAELIESDAYDFILAYQQAYDDTLHKSTPHADDAIAAMRTHVRAFERLTDAVQTHWASFDRAVLFTPDHGAHTDEATGRGAHGRDIEEDLHVSHFFSVAAGN